jgi:hypothetical protein
VSDPYHGRGTSFLHVRDDRSATENRAENPTGAVVVPISLATTFQQRTPGLATAPEDPNSFGLGYEYSRTGKWECGGLHGYLRGLLVFLLEDSKRF